MYPFNAILKRGTSFPDENIIVIVIAFYVDADNEPCFAYQTMEGTFGGNYITLFEKP